MKKQKIAPVLVAYLWLVLALFATCQLVCGTLDWKGMNHFAAQMHRLCDALLLALPLLLVPRRWLALPWLAVVNIYWLANVWYYRNFGTFIPSRQLFQFSALNGLGTSIVESMRWIDLCLPLPSLAWCLWYCRRRMDRRWRWRLAMLLIALAFSAMEILPSFRHYEPDDSRHPKVMFKEVFPKAYKKFGLAEYWVVQLQSRRPCTEQELARVAEWLDEPRPIPEMASTAAGKNLIVITVESLASWQVGLTVEGTPVTPTLDHLIADSSTVYMPNCLTQIKNGRSSDCHLMLETGLLSLADAVTSLECYSNFYYSLPKALKERGYRSETYVCDDKMTWWLQEANYKAYGVDSLLDRMGESTGEKNWDTCDQFLFPKAFARIRQLPEPFYAKVVTLSMHEADPLPQYATPLQNASLSDDYMRNFLVRTHYTDHHLGLFLDSLKACGLYDRSLIIIIGDHHKYGRNEWEGRSDFRWEDTYVPLIILNAPQRPEDQNLVFGQIDLYPTLLDLMGVGSYCWRGLGTSLFDPHHPGCATHHSMDAVGNTENTEAVERQRHMYRISDIILRSDYFSKHPLN